MHATPREASSMILLRDRHQCGGLEVLMVRRHIDSVFAGGMYVFPGGMVDEEDRHPGMEVICTGVEPNRAAVILGDSLTPPQALAFFIAAARELFEEAGILLAYEEPWEPAGEIISYKGKGGSRYYKLCERVREGKLSFRKMLEEEGLRLALDRLIYFAHWITPEISPIRFNTRFFLALAPDHQEPSHDRVETTTHLWVSPREALELCRQGSFPMLLPTVANLWELSHFESSYDALEFARNKKVTTVMPRLDPP